MLDYRNKLILAPMVRVGSLPMRLLALRYGADIVYSPEIVAKKLIRSNRVVNKLLNTIDFVDEKGPGGLILRIHPKERSRLVLQLGSADPEIALMAALKVAADVAAIDLNCGCPKKFSLHDGMGAALLENQTTLLAILDKLVSNLSIPVTCKIRLLYGNDKESWSQRTIQLLRKIEATKVQAIGIHCRYRDERPRQPAHLDVLDELASAVSIPVIANGDLWTLDDVHLLKSMTGKVTSFMFARGAQANVSLFRGEMLPCHEVMIEYLKLAIENDMPYHNAKYTLLQMAYPEDLRIPFHQQIIRCRTLEQICELFTISDFYSKTLQEREERKNRMLETAVEP